MAWAHLYRDGFPATGQTHLARGIGGFMAMWACALAYGWWGAAIGAAVWVGFYLDQKHGEGQQARDLKDAGYLALSGVTSLALPAAVAWVAGQEMAALALLVVATLKPGIWFAAWRVNPARWHPWLEPTRVSAILFGAAVGAAMVAP
jgi:fucose permease